MTQHCIVLQSILIVSTNILQPFFQPVKSILLHGDSHGVGDIVIIGLIFVSRIYFCLDLPQLFIRTSINLPEIFVGLFTCNISGIHPLRAEIERIRAEDHKTTFGQLVGISPFII